MGALDSPHGPVVAAVWLRVFRGVEVGVHGGGLARVWVAPMANASRQSMEGLASMVHEHSMTSEVSRLRIGCHACHATRKNELKRPLWGAANRLREHVVRAGRLTGRVEHVHGPRNVECGPEELVVITLTRDASVWLDAWMDHHLALGAKHIFVLDNDSSDDTVERAVGFPHVSVYRTTMPFKHFQLGMRRWLSRTFGRNRWALAPDADELWDYPFSDRLSLRDFLRYQNEHGYKAVTAHALDMFSDLPFSHIESRPGDDLRDTYRFYDLSDIITTREMYWIRDGQTKSRDIFCTFGGVRQRFFGSECLCQTRHALHQEGGGARPYLYDGHFAAGAPVSDVATVLLHYKFVSTLYDQAKKNLELGQLHRGSAHYRGFVDVLTANPEFSMWTERARELRSVNQLVDEGFLTVSDAYLQWVDRHGARAGRMGAAPAAAGVGTSDS